MVSYNGTVYLIGGYSEEFGNNYNTVWKFNEDENIFEDGPTMHYKRNSFACGIYHRYVKLLVQHFNTRRQSTRIAPKTCFVVVPLITLL